MELEQALYMRRTTRNYKPEQITKEELDKILEAAQTAPLAMGDHETTHITVLQDPEILGEIREACKVKSRKSDKILDSFHGAQTVIFISATDISSDHIEYSNVACIIENMILQATALELGSTYIWGCLRTLNSREDLLAKLNLPEGYTILSAFAVGYPVKPLYMREKQEKITMNIV